VRAIIILCLGLLFAGAAIDRPVRAAAPGDESIELPKGKTPSGPKLPSGVGEESDEGDDDSGGSDKAGTGAGKEKPAVLPKVHYGTEGLPKPVARLREQLLEAARTGDVERLKPILEASDPPPVFSYGEDAEPISHIKQASGDKEGREVLAIMIEILEAGWLKIDEGTEDELYVWPYFARYPLDSLTSAQKVELFKIVTAGDYQEMQQFGYYNFYRLGIAPDGRWRYFVAGD